MDSLNLTSYPTGSNENGIPILPINYLTSPSNKGNNRQRLLTQRSASVPDDGIYNFKYYLISHSFVNIGMIGYLQLRQYMRMRMITMTSLVKIFNRNIQFSDVKHHIRRAAIKKKMINANYCTVSS